MKRSNEGKKTKEQKIARKIYKEERELNEKEIREKEKIRQKMINRLRAERDAEENTKPIKRVKDDKLNLDKVSDTRKTFNTGAKISAEGRGWIGIGRQFGAF